MIDEEWINSNAKKIALTSGISLSDATAGLSEALRKIGISVINIQNEFKPLEEVLKEAQEQYNNDINIKIEIDPNYKKKNKKLKNWEKNKFYQR